MRSIYKYSIVNSEGAIISGPIIKILNVAEQYGNLVVWAEVDTNAPDRKFEFAPIGTGWNLDPREGEKCLLDSWTYVNTIQLAGGALVFHIYYKEIVSKKEKETARKQVDTNKIFTHSSKKIDTDVLNHFLQ